MEWKSYYSHAMESRRTRTVPRRVTFSTESTLYHVPAYSESRFARHENETTGEEYTAERSQYYREGVAQTGKKEFSETCGRVKGTLRLVPSRPGRDDTAREGEQGIQVPYDNH